MKQIIQNFKSGELKVDDVPVPSLKPGGLLVQNFCSLISAGTERGTVSVAKKGLVGKAKERPDQVKQVIKLAQSNGILDTYKLVKDRLNAPIPMGYSCAGEVIAVGKGINEIHVGDRVACAGGNYATHAEIVWVPKNLCVKIPEIETRHPNVESRDDLFSFEEAAFVTLGAIAMQGVRLAGITLGEKVAVIGLGLLGQLTVQLLRAAGCNMLGSDLDNNRLELARELGADCAVKNEELKAESERMTNGNGLDAVIITADTKSNQPIELAGEIARQKGKVVAVGRIGMNIPRDVYYEKELDLKVSMSYGPGRYDREYEEEGHDYPYGYVRWTEKRNMEAFLDLVAHGRINVKRLITHRFNIEEAVKAYNMIMDNKEPYLGVILNYETNPTPQNDLLDQKIYIDLPGKPLSLKSESLNVGIIGCGNYARGALLPVVREIDGVIIKGICTETSISARSVADKLKCNYCTTQYQEILADEDINAVIIATRHNTHAEIVIDALKAGKHVFVEKPLAIKEDELIEIKEVYSSLRQSGFTPILMVGFNRRYSSHAEMIIDHFKDRKNPLVMNYRVNAGGVDRNHWIQDPIEGGGRIIGEVCHFIDFLQYISRAVPKRVYAEQIGSHSSGITNDNCLINVSFSDGSIGSISYVASGDSALPKESVEIFGDGKAGVLNDFMKTEVYSNNKRKFIKSRKQDKGQKGELVAFFEAIRKGGKAPINFDALYLTTLTTFRAHDSLSTGLPIDIS